MAVTVLIVDDDAGFRGFARDLLGAEGYDVVGEAGDGESALDAARELHPDVVMLDIQLPGMDGFEVARTLHEQGDAPAIVLISSREALDYGARLSDAPGRGFITKGDLSGAALAELLANAA